MQARIRIIRDEVTPSLRRLTEKLGASGRRRILERMGDKFLRITWENFGVNGRHRPNNWPPLSEKYKKMIGYFGPPKLILNGDLISSIRQLGLTSDYVEVGTDCEYAEIHQFGQDYVPKRAYFPVQGIEGSEELTPYAQQQLENILEEELGRV